MLWCLFFLDASTPSLEKLDPLQTTTTQWIILRFLKVKSLFCLATPPEHTDYLIIIYFTIFRWNPLHFITFIFKISNKGHYIQVSAFNPLFTNSSLKWVKIHSSCLVGIVLKTGSDISKQHMMLQSSIGKQWLNSNIAYKQMGPNKYQNGGRGWGGGGAKYMLSSASWVNRGLIYQS